MSLSSKIVRVVTAAGLALAALLTATLLTAAPARAGVPFYKIVNVTSGKCIDMRLQDGVFGARAQSYTCHGNANQRFAIQDAGTTPSGIRYFKLVSGQGPCLEIRGASSADGAIVDQRGCSGDAHQMWFFRADPSGAGLKLVNLRSGKCISPDGTTSNYGVVLQRDCGTAAGEAWRTVYATYG